jgi:hypothetical protein
MDANVTAQPHQPQGLHVEASRVYYDPTSGEVVHVHRLVSAPGERLGEQAINREMNAFAESLRQRHTRELEVLAVEEAELNQLISGGGRLRVEAEARRLVTDP